MIRILNSQSRRKEDFVPFDPEGRRVTMYACGPTVYDSLHLGHARAAILPDVVRRYLEFKGYHVRFVTNFTDVDDKIIQRSIAENRHWRDITTTYIDETHRVLLALGNRPADFFPRATDHIAEMLELVERLLARENAYIAEDGDVYFDTTSYARYGALSGRKLEEQDAGSSGRVAQERLQVKHSPGDFVLWKLNKNDKEEIARGGDQVPGWKSPWGFGRPGWHLECSAMSQCYLGVPFDIHTGGMDLLFPHHEDEKAQTECAFSEELGDRDSVRYWLHNAFVTVKARAEDAGVDGDLVDGDSGSVKMSKSLGNVKWLREMIWPEGPFDPMAVRMMVLSTHYRSPIVFEPALLDEASARLERIYNALDGLDRAVFSAGDPSAGDVTGGELGAVAANAREAFCTAMDDDFNTAGALGAVFSLVGAANQVVTGLSEPDSHVLAGCARARSTIRTLLDVLGIRPERAAGPGSTETEGLLEVLLQARQGARRAKQFDVADGIRDGLAALGFAVKDLPDGTSEVRKES